MKKIMIMIIVAIAIYASYSCVKDGSEYSKNVIDSHFESLNID